MNRKSAGIAFALCLLIGSSVNADDDRDGHVKKCRDDWVTSCSKECATARCVSNCTTQAHDQCGKDITAQQKTFSGPVTGTPTNECTPPDGRLACAPGLAITIDSNVAPDTAASCSVIAGTVANHAYWGGDVTIYVICPAGSPVGNPGQATTSTVVGQAQSSCTDGTFSITATNQCGGQTGCYGLIAATPPTSCEACGTCGDTAPAPGDPGWNGCTSTACPSP